jgi:hypothetical protein
MLPLILLALGLGVALTTYEFSPQARARINDYMRAIREAHASHQAADAHLSNAHTATKVAAQHAQTSIDAPVTDALLRAAQVAADAAVDHVLTATTANQQAAQSTVDAARSAQTAAQRGAAADSAAKVLERGKKIEEALASLGVGQCGVRSYPYVTPQVRDAILAKLHAEGMTVTGNNPWDVDTQLFGVKLRAVWDPRAQVLKLIVTASAAFAPCGVIWERIESKLRDLIGAGDR